MPENTLRNSLILSMEHWTDLYNSFISLKEKLWEELNSCGEKLQECINIYMESIITHQIFKANSEDTKFLLEEYMSPITSIGNTQYLLPQIQNESFKQLKEADSLSEEDMEKLEILIHISFITSPFQSN